MWRYLFLYLESDARDGWMSFFSFIRRFFSFSPSVLFLTTSFVCQLVSLFFFNKFLSCFIPRTFFSVDSVASKIKVAGKINFWLKTKNTSIKKLISSVLSSKVFFLKFIFVLNMRIFECEGVRMWGTLIGNLRKPRIKCLFQFLEIKIFSEKKFQNPHLGLSESFFICRTSLN